MENKKENYAIRTIDNITIPVVNIAATYVEESEYIGHAQLRAVVYMDDDKAYLHFNPKNTHYPNFQFPPKGDMEDVLIKDLEYDWMNAQELQNSIKPLLEDTGDYRIDNDRNVFLDDHVWTWVEKKARWALRSFNKRIYEKMNGITKYTHIEF